MNNQKQYNSSLPSVARSAITLMLFSIIFLASDKSKAQQYDTLTCPLDRICSGFSNFNAGIRDTICVNEILTLRGTFSTYFNGTTPSWSDVSACIDVTPSSTLIGTSTAIVGTDTIFYGNFTFTSPGVYMFRFSALCIDHYFAEPISTPLDDTVRIFVLPIPLANAGNDTLSCGRDTNGLCLHNYMLHLFYLDKQVPGAGLVLDTLAI